MSVFYEMHGELKARKCPEVDTILKEFTDQSGDLEADLEEANGQALVRVAGGLFCSYSTVETLDEILQKLGPYVTEPAELTTVCDGEVMPLYVGPAHLQSETVSARVLGEIKERVPLLTPADRTKLRQFFNFPSS